MKKFALFAGFVGALFVVAAANADIKTATTNRVRNSVYNITYGAPGSGADNTTVNGVNTGTNNYGYRHGTVPQTNKLTAIEGTSITYGSGTHSDVLSSVSGTPDIEDVTVGELPATTTVGNVTSPTQTIKANKANIAVLKRDKLAVAATGNCSGTGVECGYVTTGDHSNQPQDNSGNGKVWMKIALACDASGTCSNNP